jgi:hypothetical protein
VRSSNLSVDDFFWCDHLHVTREIRELKDLRIRGFKAYCSKMGRDIDESFCHHCFLEG